MPALSLERAMTALVLLLASGPASAAEVFENFSFYLGDLHAHTGASEDGASADLGADCAGDCGAIAELGAYIEDNGLDFVSFTDHVNGEYAADPADFDEVLAAALALDDPEGGRVVVPGAELWFAKDKASFGHKNLYLFGS